jgi:hypothetical protein
VLRSMLPTVVMTAVALPLGCCRGPGPGGPEKGTGKISIGNLARPLFRLRETRDREQFAWFGPLVKIALAATITTSTSTPTRSASTRRRGYR